MAVSRDVEIFGQRYVLQAEEGNERELEELAAHVDEAMHVIASGSRTVDTLKIAILAAVHIAHELAQARRETERLREEVRSSAENMDTLLRRALEP